ncbi:MAG: sugar phosphate isomerase/epimerase family protein [Chthoniobacterales bacterium]
MSNLTYNIESFQNLSTLGISTSVLPLETLPQRLATLKGAGYEYVYFGDLFHDETHDLVKAKNGFQELRQIIADAGLKIYSSHYVLMYPGLGDTIERAKATHQQGLEVAAEMALTTMTTHYISITNTNDPAFVRPETFTAYAYNPILGAPALFEEALAKLGGREVFLEKNNEMYRWFCDEAALRGLTVTLETAICQFTRTPAQIIEIIKEIGSPNLGICLDSGHTHIAGVDVAEAVRQCGSYLKETHFHDNFGDLDLHRPIGIGTINWPEVILALREIDYPGPVTFEANGAPHCSAEDELQIYAKNWRELLQTTSYNEARHKAFTGKKSW